MQAFAERIERLGLAFDRPPAHVEALGLTIAFLTDPAGSYIEITEGMRDAEASP